MTLGRARTGVHGDAELLDVPDQRRARRRRRAAPASAAAPSPRRGSPGPAGERVRGLEPEQPAADHGADRRAGRRPRGSPPGPRSSGRRSSRRGPGPGPAARTGAAPVASTSASYVHRLAVGRGHGPGLRSIAVDRGAEQQLHARVVVPALGEQGQLVGAPGREVRRQRDPVVRRPGLLADAPRRRSVSVRPRSIAAWTKRWPTMPWPTTTSVLRRCVIDGRVLSMRSVSAGNVASAGRRGQQLARRRRRSRRSRWWPGWCSRTLGEVRRPGSAPAVTPAQAQTSASSGEQRRARDRRRSGISSGRRARRAEHRAAVEELGDQADPREVADQDGGDDDAVADHELAVRAHAPGWRPRRPRPSPCARGRRARRRRGRWPAAARRCATRRTSRRLARSGRAASTPACSQAGGTKPVVRPRCSAQSPIAWIRASVTDAQLVVDHDRRAAPPARPGGPARSTAARRRRARPGRCRACTPLSRRARRRSAGRPGRRCRPRCRAGAGRAPGSRRPAPTWPESRCSPPSTTSVARPRTASARATWRPSRPPPTTTARSGPGTARRSRRQSASSGRRAPSRAGARRAGPGRGSAAGSGCCRSPAPGGRTARCGAVDEHAPRAGRGRCAATRAPRRRSTPWAAYHAGSRRVSSLDRVGALEHRGEQDPVVRRVRLVAEHGELAVVPRATSSSTRRVAAIPLPTTTSLSSRAHRSRRRP